MAANAALILAAGKGTRMHSARPKVLQTLLGEPMLAYVLAALEPVFADALRVVVGHAAEQISAAFPQLRCVYQQQQLGTGHALMQAMPELEGMGATHVLVVNGDTPLLDESLVRRFLAGAEGADLAFAAIVLDDPAAYGRVLRRNGEVTDIVEARDYDIARHGPLTGEVNAGMYMLRLDAVRQLLPRLGNSNRSGEYYITDLVGLAAREGLVVRGVDCGRDAALLGVNSPAELALMEELLRRRSAENLLQRGVVLHAPELVRVCPLASVEPGAELTGPCEVYGASRIATGAQVASHCVIRNCSIGCGACVRSFSHLENATVGSNAQIGPFARLRPGAEIAPRAHVGNFVELKNARLGEGAKANHLSYLGDADVGAEANIGAGTITCNYDGRHKHRTHIGRKAFIGSNTALVAPVRVGDASLVGAGSVITRDVPDGEMGIAREKQHNLPRRRG